MLGAGVKPLDTVARWLGVVVLLLGIAGIAVTFVFHLPWPLIVVILLGIMLVVVAEGAYRVWHKTNQDALSAQAARDAATQDLEDQRQAHEKALAAQVGYTGRKGPEPLEPCYLDQRGQYRLPNANMVHHRIGIRNPAGNPEATGVRLQWTEMSPRPRTDLFPPVIPQAVPMQAGGDPTIGIPLPPGREELWVIATTATDQQGVMTVGVFGPDRFGWHGTPWHFEPHDRWRFTYRIVADNIPARVFSVVMYAVDGWIRCDLED